MRFFLLIITFTFSILYTNAQSSNYCIINGNIDSIQINTVSIANVLDTIPSNFAGTLRDKVIFTLDSVYNITLTTNSSSNQILYWKIWFDLDGDGLFDQPNELVHQVHGAANDTLVSSFSISDSVLTFMDSTRILIGFNYSDTIRSCDLDVSIYYTVRDHTKIKIGGIGGIFRLLNSKQYCVHQDSSYNLTPDIEVEIDFDVNFIDKNYIVVGNIVITNSDGDSIPFQDINDNFLIVHDTDTLDSSSFSTDSTHSSRTYIWQPYLKVSAHYEGIYSLNVKFYLIDSLGVSSSSIRYSFALQCLCDTTSYSITRYNNLYQTEANPPNLTINITDTTGLSFASSNIITLHAGKEIHFRPNTHLRGCQEAIANIISCPDSNDLENILIIVDSLNDEDSSNYAGHVHNRTMNTLRLSTSINDTSVQSLPNKRLTYTISPNPVRELLFIKPDSTQKDIVPEVVIPYKVINMLGKTVDIGFMSIKESQVYYLDTRYYPDGIYFLSFTSRTKRYNIRFVKIN